MRLFFVFAYIISLPLFAHSITCFRALHKGIDKKSISILPTDLQWENQATQLLSAIRENQPGNFPAEVNGLSLIPPQALLRLQRQLHKFVKINGSLKEVSVSLDRIESIGLESLYNSPGSETGIVINYFKANEQTASKVYVAVDREEFTHWKNYLENALKHKQTLELDIHNLPKERQEVLGSFSVKTNSFNTRRILKEYDEQFNGRLIGVLKNLGSNARWIDMGAGEARAMIGFLTGLRKGRRPLPEIPECLAIGYKYPGGAEGRKKLSTLKSRYQGRFNYIEGKLGPTGLKRLPKADVITDVMGIATYSNPDPILKSYVDRLNSGGIAFVSTYSFGEKIQTWLSGQKAKGVLDYEMLDQGTVIIKKK